MMNDNTGGEDGFSLGSPDGLIKEFLDPGLDFAEQLARAGLPLDDALDYAEMWRTGITFRVPEMIYHAMHVLIASMGADRQARSEALSAIIGHRQMQQNVMAKKRAWFGKGKSDADSPQKMDAEG